MKREMPQADGFVFNDVVLDETCLFAHRNGEQIRFTRSERALLLVLSRNPHRLMQRSQLLDAIAPTQTDASDRNVDFLVNRLRTKLGDSARAPRFIATQYGEGYVWIATGLPAVASRPDPTPVGGLLAIAPVVAPHDKRLADRADVVTTQMRDMIAGRLGAGETVIMLERDEGTATRATRYVLKVSFQHNGDRLDCTATLREGPSRRIIRAFRLEFGNATMASLVPEVERASIGIIEALQRNLAEASEGLGTPLDQPHEIRVREASTLLSASNPNWLEKGLQLREARAENPASADIALQWCLHLFSRLVLANPFTGISRDERDEIESEIEATVLDCLPLIDTNPLLMLTAAKLLYFVDRGHLELAEDLADRAFDRMTDSAAALPVLGQLRQARGDFAAAVAFFDRGIEMADPDSAFELHMRVLKSIALLAAGDSEGLKAASFAYDSPHSTPDLRVMIATLITPAGQQLPKPVTDVLIAVGSEGARNAIDYTYMTSVRHITSLQARANIMRGLVGHMTRLHGKDVVAPFVLVGTGLIAVA
ncbi:DNA-binding winged helix-turn-helix (wHTH) protein [Angulomicrobium tetraedrale]|uniref:DNA-binding winged helix-turn-helix (WHTH) protein n=1 Tax=Ancylobacter tetraedralis TaxID=217068 RepID=A0A839ZG06_9HYPH|nr:winged helix-turn-helix domain-containing protein [Ancylobacter tetraedralis]MBB3773773.1 DNA-binding winged helix-turn-helix (wHTH) protein [Ancylobacter tetraedralis]